MQQIALILFALLLVPNAYAEWLCRETSSVRNDNQVTACGIGENSSEAIAREEANQSAYKEFFLFCKQSADCREQKILIYPRRNECLTQLDNSYKCYRAIDFYITKNKRDYVLMDYTNLEQEVNERKQILDNIKERDEQIRNIQSLDTQIKFISPNISYWNLGVGVSIRSDSVSGHRDLRKSGYNIKFGRCFYSKVCIAAETEFGNITKRRDSNSQKHGMYQSYSGVLDVYLNKYIFIEGAYGQEISQYTFHPDAKQDFIDANLGVSFIPAKPISIELQGGVRNYLDNSISRGTMPVNFKAMLNFKF